MCPPRGRRPTRSGSQSSALREHIRQAVGSLPVRTSSPYARGSQRDTYTTAWTPRSRQYPSEQHERRRVRTDDHEIERLVRDVLDLCKLLQRHDGSSADIGNVNLEIVLHAVVARRCWGQERARARFYTPSSPTGLVLSILSPSGRHHTGADFHF